ncbi:MAG: NnrU family protein [Deltaproteobacteria bacterium]
MASLTLATLYFIGIHVFISGTKLRDAMVARIGEGPFMGVFSLASIAGMVWIVSAYRAAPLIPLWSGSEWSRILALVVMLPAVFLVMIGLTTPSPTTAGMDRSLGAGAHGILRVTRHPFLSGIVLWGLTHMIANGDAASLLLFGGFTALAALGPRLIDTKRSRRLGEDYEDFMAVTSTLPFAAIVSGRNRFEPGELGAARVLLALAVYAALLGSHRALFGVSPLG